MLSAIVRKRRLSKDDLFHTGFTIIELLIALAITGMVSAGLFSVFNTCMVSWNSFKEAESLSAEGNAFLPGLLYYIKLARKINSVQDGTIWLYTGATDIIYSLNTGDKTIYRIRSTPTSYEKTAVLKNVSAFKPSINNKLLIISLTLKGKRASTTLMTATTRRLQ